MTSETTTGPETTPAAPPPKKGRGPTRDAVKFADTVEAVGRWSPEDRATLVRAIQGGITAKTARDATAVGKRSLAAHVKEREAEFRREERIADTLQTVEGLSPILRAALVRTLEPDAPVA